MEEKQKFAQFLCAKRIEAGLTQKQLAQRLFVSDAAVSKWERGLSYPDITLVASICRELHITEHEFVTACDDVAAREEKRQAKNFRRFLLIYQIVMGCAYLLALIPCFIVNLALEHRLSWFFIVLVSLMLAFSITNLPLMLKKHKTFISLAAASGLLLVLLAVCCLYVGGDWLFSIAYPCALVGLAYVWAMAAMVFYWKAQPLLRAGVCCMFTGVCVFFANPLFSQITKTPTYPVSAYFAPGLWQGPWVGQTASIRINVLVAGGFVLVGIAMAAAGLVRMYKAKRGTKTA